MTLKYSHFHCWSHPIWSTIQLGWSTKDLWVIWRWSLLWPGRFGLMTGWMRGKTRSSCTDLCPDLCGCCETTCLKYRMNMVGRYRLLSIYKTALRISNPVRHPKLSRGPFWPILRIGSVLLWLDLWGIRVSCRGWILFLIMLWGGSLWMWLGSWEISWSRVAGLKILGGRMSQGRLWWTWYRHLLNLSIQGKYHQ